MSWQILVLLSVVLISFGGILQKVVMKDQRSDPWAYSITFQFLVGVFVATYGFAFSDMTLPTNIRPLIPNLVLMVLLWSANNILLFSALKRIEASIFTVIFSTRSLFTTLASSLFLSEFLSRRQFVGAFFILLGAVFVTFTKKTGFKFDKGIIYAVLATAAFGFANTNDRVLLGSFNLYPYITLAFVLPSLFLVFVKPSSVYNLKLFTNFNILKKMILLCLIYALASIAFFRALQIAPNSSQVATISVTSVVLTVFLSIIFLKERENMGRKIIGALSAFIGLLLVS